MVVRLAAKVRRTFAAPPPVEQRLLFLFCGKSHSWRETGQWLHANEPLFRDGIDAADDLVREIAGFSPSAAFAGKWLPPDWPAEAKSEIVVMALTQFGLVDLWRQRGGGPAGYLGLSAGEFAAAYAAGMLTRPQAVRTAAVFAQLLSHPGGHTPSFQIAAHEALARWLAANAPGGLEFSGEVSMGVSQLLTSNVWREANREFLSRHVAILAEFDGSLRYHVPDCGMAPGALFDSLPVSAPCPADAAVYFSSFGGRVPAGTRLGGEHWQWMVTSPYCMAGAGRAAREDGFNRYAAIGARTIANWFEATATSLGKPVQGVWLFEPGGEPHPLVRLESELGKRPHLSPPRLPAARVAVDAAGVDLDLPAYLADPVSVYEQLRCGGPVQFLPRHSMWIVLGHQAMREAMSRPETFSHREYGNVDRLLIGAEPDAHGEVRRLVARQLTPARIRSVAALVEELAPTLLKPRFDALRDYAQPVARAAAACFMGAPPDLVADLARISASVRGKFADMTAAIDPLMDRFAIYRAVATGLSAAQEADLRGLVRFLWLASITTTERLILRCAMRLVAEPSLRQRLRDELALVPAFVEEVLRLHPPEHMIPRVAAQPCALAGQQIAAGDMVYLCMAAANRDPAVFSDPHALRLDRRDNPHLSFGHGIHHCSGTGLARRIVPIAVRALVDAPRLVAVQPIETVIWRQTRLMREPEGLVIGA